MTRKVLLATEKPFAAHARDQVVAIIREAGFEPVVLESYKGKEDLLRAVADVDALIVRSDIVDKEVLDAGKKLALVVRAGAGYDNIDCEAAKAKGIAVMNTPGQNANAVGELALGLMIYMARAKFSGKSGTELRGKKLGCHAIGATGSALAGAAKGIGMQVYAFDPYVPADKMREMGVEPVAKAEDLYRTCDYVSLHMPANEQTKRSIGKSLLMLMPKKGCLVNTARAELIHEEELLHVFEARPDVRYVADVEPSPTTAAILREKYGDRVYWTPKKMGAQTEEANVNAGLAAARQIVGFFLRGERRFIVNP